MKNKKITVCMYGAASNNISDTYIKEVERLGEVLAKNNFALVYGAGATGLMGAVARGMTKGNGEIIGVSPHFMHDFEPIYDKCTETIYTENMAERKSIMENKANAFIISPGGIGTLDEFFQILTLRQLKRHNKEIILFNFNGFYDSTISLINEFSEKGFVNKNVSHLYKVCNTVEEILDFVKQIEAKSEESIFETVETLNIDGDNK